MIQDNIACRRQDITNCMIQDNIICRMQITPPAKGFSV
jgi:hypothetical protein